jgi:inosine/xanthosine triphosphate pyrophosphatase family protein
MIEVDTEAIAKNKAILAAQLAGGPCVVEDTSLEFTSLGGMPGPYYILINNFGESAC